MTTPAATLVAMPGRYGADAAAFPADVRARLEEPMRLLIEKEH